MIKLSLSIGCAKRWLIKYIQTTLTSIILYLKRPTLKLVLQNATDVSTVNI